MSFISFHDSKLKKNVEGVQKQIDKSVVSVNIIFQMPAKASKLQMLSVLNTT